MCQDPVINILRKNFWRKSTESEFSYFMYVLLLPLNSDTTTTKTNSSKSEKEHFQIPAHALPSLFKRANHSSFEHLILLLVSFSLGRIFTWTPQARVSVPCERGLILNLFRLCCGNSPARQFSCLTIYVCRYNVTSRVLEWLVRCVASSA